MASANPPVGWEEARLENRGSREKSNIIRVSISYPNQSKQNEALASTQSLDTRTGSSKTLRAVCILHLINKKTKQTLGPARTALSAGRTKIQKTVAEILLKSLKYAMLM
jgi:hypothetical protein